MKRKEALQILMEHAARDVRGVGCGVRPSPSEKERALVREAWAWAHAVVYGREADSHDFYNAGLG